MMIVFANTGVLGESPVLINMDILYSTRGHLSIPFSLFGSFTRYPSVSFIHFVHYAMAFWASAQSVLL
jgi:hypothetical protein